MKNKARFYQRLGAYLVDILVIMLIASVVTTPFIDMKSLDQLDSESTELIQKLQAGEISIKTYYTEAMSISYQMAKVQGLTTLVALFLNVLYYIVFQFYNDGQTLGKKLFRIRVTGYKNKKLNINNYIYRSLIINSLLLDMIVFALIIFGNSTDYFYGYLVIELMDYLLLLVSSIMTIFRRDGRGLHDLLAGTSVVRVEV